ncbi:ATP-binding protein [Marinomonas ostreistagni]|uniref:histidine kinase n=1 Tax=Marinomonas ostreistagni TaxID=359209 RepID=A0ABS0Z9S9_9GAMM|nr:ATP-binding protein [Marinomonas ostreistagni]MBJ7550411.1 CHASE domain-containing protein [Marinomonas ostreistagni]
MHKEKVVAKMTRVLKIILLTAISYFIAGWIGQVFAIPPGYATVIWPASGIAIAACLLFGYWPALGVFVGSTCVNVLIGFENTGQISILIPALIASGSALQTIFAYSLVRFFIGKKLEFYNVRHVLSFIVVAGPLGCLVSASTGTTILYSFGMLSSDQVLLNWLSWWLGDTVGVVVLVPWLAVLFRKHFSVYYDHPMRVVFALVIVALTTGILSFSTAFFEINKQKQAFNASADLSSTLLSERIKNSVDILYSMAGYVRGSAKVSAEEFQNFSESIMSQDRAIKALSINHVLDYQDIPMYESQMSALHGFPYQVKERSVEGEFVAPSVRDRYVPVGLIYPKEPNLKALGFDVYSEASRRSAIQNAIRLNAAFPTSAITLVQGNKAVLMFLPIYKQQKLFAMSTGLFEIEDLSERILERTPTNGVEIYLIDRPAGQSPYILSASGNATLEISELIDGVNAERYPVIHRSMIPVEAHRWELVHIARSSFIEQPWGTHFVLVGGLFVAGLLGWVLSLVFSHAAQVERQVAERTKELSKANLALRESSEKLKQATLAAQDANQAKSRFLANMSHEIRTPLNGMLGSLSLLKSQRLNNEQVKLVDLAHQSGDTLLGLVNDILDLSKIEAGELELEPQYFDLQDLLEDTASLMRIKAKEKDLTFIAPETLLPELMVYGDRQRLQQVILNLLGNAIKFTAAGGDVRLKAENLLLEGDKATFRISIQDTGIGISDSLQQRLFQRFKQADASTTRRYGGTGLGLAISKQLIEAMQGQIGVQSQLGQGANFWFELTLPIQPKSDESLSDLGPLKMVYVLSQQQDDVPYIRSLLASKSIPVEFLRSAEELPTLDDSTLLIIDDALRVESQLSFKVPQQHVITLLEQGQSLENLDGHNIASIYKPVHRRALFAVIESFLQDDSMPVAKHAELNSAVEDDYLKDMRILLVEDNLTNQIVAKGMLGLFGVTVDVVENGEESVTACQETAYDLIFMDCQMPVMDGYEATKAIRKLEQNSATSNNVVIVALSANAMKGDDQLCFDAGMDDHVAKPVTKERLAEVLERWLGKRS